MKIFSSISPFASTSEKSCDWILWPDSCWLLSNRPLFVPDFEEEFFAIPALAGKIGRIGKSVAGRFCHRYLSELTAALIILPFSAIEKLKEGTVPEPSHICFDNAIVLGDWTDVNLSDDPAINLTFIQSFCGRSASNKEVAAEEYDVCVDRLYPVLAEVSRKNTLKMGDVALYPLPLPPRRISEGDACTIFIRQFGTDPVLSTRFK